MKKQLTSLFWPILKIFETGGDASTYKKSHRVALLIMGPLFLLLALGAAIAAYTTGEMGALIPVMVFLCVGSVAWIVGTLGSDAAVCKIWGNRS